MRTYALDQIDWRVQFVFYCCSVFSTMVNQLKIVWATVFCFFTNFAFAANCIEFDGEKYCEAWRKETEAEKYVEFLVAGQTIERWSTMLTARKYQGKSSLKEVIPGYIAGIKPMFAIKPEILVPDDSDTDEVYILALLLAPDMSHYEHVVNRFYLGSDGNVNSIFYSYRLPFEPAADFSEVMKNRHSWMMQLKTMQADEVLGTK